MPTDGRLHLGRFLLAAGVSAALILGAPFIGQLRAAVRAAFPERFVLIIGVVIVGAVAAAIGTALVRIRDRRRLRYGAIVTALVIGVGYAVLSSTGNPEVDAVERFHFVEYGLIALLFYRAWRPIGDGSLLILPLLAGLLVGTLEEWLQWFIPARVGEVRDVFLNLWALVCGLLFSVGLDPPDRLTLRLRRESWRRVRRVAAVVLLVFGAFFHSVHLGYTVDDPATGAFRSRYTAENLDELARARADAWRTQPPLTWARLSREDQYMSEGVAHVQRRNQAWQDGGEESDRDVAAAYFRAAWHENLILERYFTPVLDTTSYISATGHRWPAEHRAEAERRYVPDGGTYSSEADENPIFPWSKPPFWGAVGVLVSLLVFPRNPSPSGSGTST